MKILAITSLCFQDRTAPFYFFGAARKQGLPHFPSTPTAACIAFAICNRKSSDLKDHTQLEKGMLIPKGSAVAYHETLILYLYFRVFQFLFQYQSLLFPFFQRTLPCFPFLLLEHPCQLLVKILHVCLAFGVPLAQFCVFRVQLLVPGLQICHLKWDSRVSYDYSCIGW